MKLVLPYPPTINHYYCRKRDGNLFIGKRGKEYRLATKMAFIQTGEPPIDGAVHVVVRLICPDYRRRDLDNTQKCILDAVVKSGALEDDSSIVSLFIYKHKPDAYAPEGRAIILIEPASMDGVEVKNAGAWLV